MSTFNYPGYFRIEEYPVSFFQDSSGSFLELPWLSLLCSLPLNEAKQDQPVPIGYHIIQRSIYDRNTSLLFSVLRQLKEIFPHSFLFQESIPQYQYRVDHVRILTLEWLKILNDQMTVFDFSHPLEEEKILMELIRVVWRQTQMPKQCMTLHAFDDESSLPFEEYQKLTWFVPFNEFYKMDNVSIKRYMCVDL